VGGYASALPSNLLVVEIREDVPADPDVLKACRALKAGGCAIALDDIVTTAPPRAFSTSPTSSAAPSNRSSTPFSSSGTRA
jgi:c-di-GMP-related signal transduction protein